MKPVRWAQQITDRGTSLSAPARHVALCIAVHARATEQASSECSLSQISTWSGLSEATCKRALRELVSAGWLVNVRQRTRSGADAAPRRLLIVPDLDP